MKSNSKQKTAGTSRSSRQKQQANRVIIGVIAAFVLLTSLCIAAFSML